MLIKLYSALVHKMTINEYSILINLPKISFLQVLYCVLIFEFLKLIHTLVILHNPDKNNLKYANSYLSYSTYKQFEVKCQI